jgi:hypothetical protein
LVAYEPCCLTLSLLLIGCLRALLPDSIPAARLSSYGLPTDSDPAAHWLFARLAIWFHPACSLADTGPRRRYRRKVTGWTRWASIARSSAASFGKIPLSSARYCFPSRT